MTTNRQDLEAWIPTEVSQTVITQLTQQSAVEAVGRPEVMTSDTKQVPRMGGFTVATVAKGAEYGFSTNTPDVVELIARKIGGLAKIAEEDLVDTVTGEGTMRRYEESAGNALAVHYDNAALGVTAAANGTTIPFTSVYRALSQNDSGAGYTGGANILQTAGGLTYADIVAFLALYEESLYFNEGNTVVIASPAFKAQLRNLLDGNGRPLFTDPVAGGEPTLFGYRARWSRGARTSTVATQSPAGNPFMLIANADLLINGRARTSAGMVPGNPGVAWQRANNGVGFLSDEAIMKATMRRGFALGHPAGAAILEITAAP